MFPSQPKDQGNIPVELKRHVKSLRKTVWHRKGLQENASATNARYDTTVIQQQRLLGRVQDQKSVESTENMISLNNDSTIGFPLNETQQRIHQHVQKRLADEGRPKAMRTGLVKGLSMA